MSARRIETPEGEAAPRRWKLAGLAALAVIVVAVPLSLLRAPSGPPAAEAEAAFVGSAACRDCHQAAWEAWEGSDHDLAMAEAGDGAVLGDFDDAEVTHRGATSRFYRKDGKFLVWTEGPGGEMGEFEIAYTFGHEPLQQYLVPFPGGRLQALSLAWDTERGEWFHLYGDQDVPAGDWLHWTRGGQNWNGMCAECHSTDLKKGYDPQTRTYNTTWSDIDVGCEACHGPGSLHVAWAGVPAMARDELDDYALTVPAVGIAPARLVELCAPCHSRRSELGDYDHTAPELLDQLLPSTLREGLYHADGQISGEVYVYGSFVQSKMYARGVSCRDCHDSHSLKLRYEGNALCLQCHGAHVYDSPDHHFHQLVSPEGDKRGTVDGQPSDGALCVKCHMPEQPYMVVDWRADHSLRVPRPDLSAEIGTPNACGQGGCHADQPLEWSLDAYRRWYLQVRRPHFGTTFAAARAGEPQAAEELVHLAGDTLQPPLVRATALELLQRYGGEAVGAALRAAAADPEPLLRRTAAASLALTDPAERVSLLAPLLSDPVKAVRLAAVAQLAGVPRELFEAYQREALDRGLDEYRSAMAYSLDFAAQAMNLGNLAVSLGRPGEAERHFRGALEIDDLFYPAKMNLAVLANGQGRNEEAETLLREVLEAYPENADAAYSLGLLLVEMGRPAEAVNQLLLAVQGMPRNARARYNLGLLLQQQGRLDEAAAELAAALELEPESLDYLYALADHRLRRGQLEQTLALAERMIAAHPGERIGHDLKAMVERAQGQPGG